MQIEFKIAHTISSSKGWGRYQAATAAGPLVQSSTGNVWVSAPHAGEAEDGTEITVTLQTMERVRRTGKENIATEVYRLIARPGSQAELGYWNGLLVVVSGAAEVGRCPT